MSNFMSNADLLFDKKNTQENKEELEKFANLDNELAALFKSKKEKIKNIMNKGKDNCNKLIREEKKNLDNNLKNANNDIEKAKNSLLEKIEEILDLTRKEQENELKLLAYELNALIEKKESNLFSNNDISDKAINVENKKLMPGNIYLGTSSIFGGGLGLGIASILPNASLIGGSGLGACFLSVPFAGFVAGIAATTLISISLYNYFKKSDRYKEIIESMQAKIIEYWENLNSTFDNDFKYYEDSVMNDFNVKREIKEKNIDTIDENKWKEMKNEYLNLKTNIKNIINYNNN